MEINIFNIILSGFFGAVFGSYATLFAHRLPIGQSCFGRYFGKKSHCPKCGYTLRTRELVPILNWLITLGKCSKCSTKIPRSHLFLELGSALTYILSYLKFGFTQEFMIFSLICSGCLILVVTDVKHSKLPYQVLIYLLLLITNFRVMQDYDFSQMINSAVVAIVFCAVFYQIFYKKVNGFIADKEHIVEYIKLILVLSLIFAIDDLLPFLALILVGFSFLALALNKKSKKTNFGFVFLIILPFLWFNLI